MHTLEIQNCTVEVGGVARVQDVSFCVRGGDVAVLMGPNGSGKSSLVQGIFGHPKYNVRRGEVLLDGEHITTQPVGKKAERGLFLSMQHVPTIGGVTLASFLHRAYVALHASNVSVIEFYAALVDKVEQFAIDRAILDKPLTEGLSGGEKKLSELVQLIALKPKIAILDEIDSGVDVDALRILRRVIEALKKEGVGFLIISHHPSLLTHLSVDTVHVMSNGRLVRTGDASLAKEILEGGFCAVIDCKHANKCAARCDI